MFCLSGRGSGDGGVEGSSILIKIRAQFNLGEQEGAGRVRALFLASTPNDFYAKV